MRIMFVGDINLGEYYTSFGHGPKSYLEHSNIFEHVKPIFNKADFVVGNLEAALTDHNFQPNKPESVVLRGSPKQAELLYETGFRILQVSNNHTVQHGKEGFDETVTALSEANILAIGLNNQPLTTISLDNVTAGFLAASDVPDNTDTQQDSYSRLNSEFLTKVRESVALVDHLFVMLHWGLESSTSPMQYQRDLISELAKLGVRGVIGSHPHLFYEIWRENNCIAAPSLGNFVFDLCWDERLIKTGILDLEISSDGMVARIWPVTLSDNGCLPVPQGSPTTIGDTIKIYDLGENMKGEQFRKLIYFFRNILKGKFHLKIKFILSKFISLR